MSLYTMREFTHCLIVVILVSLIYNSAIAGVVSTSGKAVREIAMELAEQTGKKASKEFVETTSVQLEKIVNKCGKESLDVIDKHGVAALRVFEAAGEEAGPYLVKGIRLYGDDGLRLAQTAAGRSVLREGNEVAIRAVIKHTDAVIPLIQRYGDDCAQALTQLSPQNGRRLIQWVDETPLPSSDILKLMGSIKTHGDEAMNFIWRHRKALITTALVGDFIINKEAYLKGAKQLAEIPVKALVDIIKTPLEAIHWNLWVGVLIMLAGLWFLFKRRASLLNQNPRKE